MSTIIKETMENKKKFIELLLKRKRESNKSTAEFLDNKVSESVYSKFINVDDYNLTDKSLSDILSLIDIDLYGLLNNKLTGEDGLYHVKIKHQFGEDGVLRPLSIGDHGSTVRNKVWGKHTAILCKYLPYEGWCSLYLKESTNNFVNREIYKVPCVLFQHDGRSMHGMYSCTKVNSNQKELFNLNTFDKIDVDFAKVTEIYPIDCSFAPKTFI